LATAKPCYPIFYAGGAERSMHGLLSCVAASADVECVAVCGAGDEGSTVPAPALHDALGIRSVVEEEGGWKLDCGYAIHFARDFVASLHTLLQDGRPTVLCTHLDRALEVLQIGFEYGAKGIWFLRDVNPKYHLPAEVQKAGALGALFIANSRFIRDWARAHCAVDASVIYPMVDLAQYRVTWNPNGYIAMINPFPEKGGFLFLEIAKLLPQERFVAVESWLLPGHLEKQLKAGIANLSNTTLLRRVPDIRVVYRQARMLLVPSFVEEAFARVILEAHTSGIPVVASNRGGIPEALGKGGILVEDYQNPQAWASFIEPLTTQSTELAALSARATENSLRDDFSITRSGDRFLEIATQALT
jgi:glycosyltransferase involved in cell wall biosynthesis